MFFPDITLAQQLEFHEVWSSVEHARIQAQLFPQTGAISMPIHGGAAVFCGEKSPLSQVYGLGLSGPVSATTWIRLKPFIATEIVKCKSVSVHSQTYLYLPCSATVDMVFSIL